MDTQNFYGPRLWKQTTPPGRSVFEPAISAALARSIVARFGAGVSGAASTARTAAAAARVAAGASGTSRAGRGASATGVAATGSAPSARVGKAGATLGRILTGAAGRTTTASGHAATGRTATGGASRASSRTERQVDASGASGATLRGLAAAPAAVRSILGRFGSGATARATTTKNASVTARNQVGTEVAGDAAKAAGTQGRATLGANASPGTVTQRTSTATLGVGVIPTSYSTTNRIASAAVQAGSAVRGFAYRLWLVLCDVTARWDDGNTYGTWSHNPGTLGETEGTATWGDDSCL